MATHREAKTNCIPAVACSNENPLVAHSASGSGTTPVSTAMRSSSGLASQVAW